MVKIEVDLSSVPSCNKKGCKDQGIKHRHHLKHEKLWIRVFANVPKMRKSKEYKKLVERYEEFRPYDTRYLCSRHHEEIHNRYREEMRYLSREIGGRFRSFQDYDWKMAKKVMLGLRRYYFYWRDQPDHLTT